MRLAHIAIAMTRIADGNLHQSLSDDTAVQIQTATPTDLEVLLPMVEQYWRFEAIEGFDATRMRKLLTRVLEDGNLGRAWVARLYGEPAGYLLAVYVFSLEHQGLTAEIDEFFVVPAHRGLGLGHQMLASRRHSFASRVAPMSRCSSGAATRRRAISIGAMVSTTARVMSW